MKAVVTLALLALLIVGAFATVAVEQKPVKKTRAKRNFKFTAVPKGSPIPPPSKKKALAPGQAVESLFDLYDSLVMGLQKCSDDAQFTIHGLWPAQEYCGGSSYSHSAIADLWSTMEQDWPSCPWSHTSADDFYSHEWEKHGSCFGTSEHTYFQDALQIYENGGWKSQCDQSSSTCTVNVQSS